MDDTIKRLDAIKYCESKAEHYRKRLARIEAQGDAIGYDPTEQINGFKDEIAIYESFVKELEDIPSAEKQDEWIPCSEGLPEEDGIYLVTARNYIFDTTAIVVGTCYFNPDYKFLGTKEILAWMPLPEPWKGADNE